MIFRKNKLRNYIIDNGLPEIDVAINCGLSVQTLGKRLQNPESFKVGEIKKISKYLNLDCKDVFKMIIDEEV